MAISAEQQRLLENDPDYILLSRYDNSIDTLLERYPEGAPDRIIGQALGVSEAEVQEMYASIVLKLREMMG